MILFQNKLKIKVKMKLNYNLNKKISLWGFSIKMVITFYKKKKYQESKKYFDF